MFLPENYELPKSEGSYAKLQDGENKFRIMSKPVIGWEDWQEEGGKKKPLRYRINAKPSAPLDPKTPIKHFWSMVAWNYSLGRIQILHLTQKSILAELDKLIKDADWGDPHRYDIKIHREKASGTLTRYSVTAVPPKPPTKEIQEAFAAKPCHLEALFDGEDPWAGRLSALYADEKAEEIDTGFYNLFPDGCDLSYLEEYMSHLMTKKDRHGNHFSYADCVANAKARMDEFVAAYQKWAKNSGGHDIYQVS